MKKELWLRLKGYHFDHLVPPHLTDHVASVFGGADASTHAFASKLSRKLGWSTRNAVRAIQEYKKFVYLGIVCDFSVTPSRIVDQVWHEHLLFSRAYREFCREVLGREFDHNPELVPTDDQTEVFQAQFEATLAAYEREFTMKPPADIWCIPKFRKEGKADPSLVKHHDAGMMTSSDDSSTPLFMYFDGGGSSHASMAEFGGGGGFSGGGGESSWGHDSSSSDSSSSGDSGDGGGSGCSSSCGGGGCGGGCGS